MRINGEVRVPQGNLKKIQNKKKRKVAAYFGVKILINVTLDFYFNLYVTHALFYS